MASNYWIKLYHEILTDPKMGRLPDNLWRRFIECCLLAGIMDQDGRLPPLHDIAWKLRIEEEALRSEFDHLSRIGLLDFINNPLDEHWIVTKFAERQAPMSAAERMRRMRNSNKKRIYYGDSDEDVTKRNTDKIRIDTDTDTDKTAVVSSHFEKNISTLTPRLAEMLLDDVDEYGEAWVIEAIDIAVSRGKRNLKYVEGILRNWRTDGKDDGNKKPLSTVDQLRAAGYNG